MLIKDTETQATQNSWFAVEDINRRAEAAYLRHQDLFDSEQHQQKVAAVEAVLRDYFAGWNAIYQTARPQTRQRPANTEVKFNRVVLNRKRRRADLLRALTELGIREDMIVSKPATESFSVHVAA